MARHQRVTFTQGHEVLEFSIRYLNRVREALDDLSDDELGERVKMLLTSVETEQRNLLGSIERVLEGASDTVRTVYTQYTVELPADIDEPEQPLTTLGLIQWLEHLNRPLQDMFKELAENRDSEEATEVFGGIAQQIESHSMRLSKEYQRTEDL